MVKCITTKYIPATATRGSKIKAVCLGYKPKSYPFPYEPPQSEKHLTIAKQYAQEFGIIADGQQVLESMLPTDQNVFFII